MFFFVEPIADVLAEKQEIAWALCVAKGRSWLLGASITWKILTARRYVNAICVVLVYVCPSVRLSQVVVLPKTAKSRITQTMPHNSNGVSRCQRSRQNFDWVAPNRGAKDRWGWGGSRSAIFDQYLAKSYYERLIGTRMRSIEWRISSDHEWPLSTSNHPIFRILYRVSYFRNGWKQSDFKFGKLVYPNKS